MSEQISFLNMFSQYQPPEPLLSVLSQAAVTAADIDPAARRIDAELYSDTYISRRKMERICDDICDIYSLRKLNLTAKHPTSELTKIEPEELMALFVEQNSMTRGSLAGAKWSWEDQKLIVELVANGKAELQECVPNVCNILREKFSVEVSIEIHAGENLQGQALFDAMEKMRGSMISDLPK